MITTVCVITTDPAHLALNIGRDHRNGRDHAGATAGGAGADGISPGLGRTVRCADREVLNFTKDLADDIWAAAGW